MLCVCQQAERRQGLLTLKTLNYQDSFCAWDPLNAPRANVNKTRDGGAATTQSGAWSRDIQRDRRLGAGGSDLWNQAKQSATEAHRPVSAAARFPATGG